MKLTKLQRHTAYIILLAELENECGDTYCRLLCHLIYKTFGLDNRGFAEGWDGRWFWEMRSGRESIDGVIRHFPELDVKNWKQWPRYFKNEQAAFNVRKKALQDCIKETA